MKRIAEREETTAAVQGVTVETLECDDGMMIESRFGFVSKWTTRGTTPPLSPISGSSIEQRGFKKVHWTESGLNSLIKSSRLFLLVSVWSLKMNRTSVAFTCSGDYDPSGQPKPLLQSSRVSLLTDRTRSGTCWVQAIWRVTVEGKSSVNKLAGVFPSQNTTVTDSTEGDTTSNESVSVEQGQLLRTAEPDQCVVKVKTLTHALLGVYGEADDDLHRRRQDSDLEDASFDRTDIAADAGMDSVLLNHNNGAVAMTVTEYTVRVCCDGLDEWRSGVCSLNWQNEVAETTLLNTDDRTRRVRTILRNTLRYSHASLGHCESSVKRWRNRYVYSFPTRMDDFSMRIQR